MRKILTSLVYLEINGEFRKDTSSEVGLIAYLSAQDSINLYITVFVGRNISQVTSSIYEAY